MKNYIKRLKSHPGVPIAFFMSFCGIFAGMANENFSLVSGAVLGFTAASLFCWPIVLWTARTQPISPEYMDDDQ